MIKLARNRRENCNKWRVWNETETQIQSIRSSKEILCFFRNPISPGLRMNCCHRTQLPKDIKLINVSFLITVNWLSRGASSDQPVWDRPGYATHSGRSIYQRRFVCFATNYEFSLQYEYKLQNTKKKKVTIEISVDGVRICLKKRKRRMKVVSSASKKLLIGFESFLSSSP